MIIYTGDLISFGTEQHSSAYGIVCLIHSMSKQLTLYTSFSNPGYVVSFDEVAVVHNYTPSLLLLQVWLYRQATREHRFTMLRAPWFRLHEGAACLA